MFTWGTSTNAPYRRYSFSLTVNSITRSIKVDFIRLRFKRNFGAEFYDLISVQRMNLSLSPVNKGLMEIKTGYPKLKCRGFSRKAG